jgi:UDP-glucose 4-epimerase|tara:strand:- start:39 stop:950 length:912 start_codon:yes stop_codon:yes gene_type:complete
MKKKCVITGGFGFIGSHIADKMIGEEWDVICLDNESNSENNIYHNLLTTNKNIDICDYESIKPYFENVDCVFHLAAESRIQPSIENPIQACKTNLVGTANVLQASREFGVERVVYSSTSSYYGLKNQSPLTEEMPRDCLNPYSVTKVGAEDLCKMYNDLFGLNTITFRYFNVYGERAPKKGTYAPVVGLFIDMYNQGKVLTVVGDGEQRRDFVHVKDVVEANYLAATTKNECCFGEVFNVGSGENFSINDLARMVAGEENKAKHIPERKAEARETLADISKIKSFLQWRPSVNFESWIKKQIK